MGLRYFHRQDLSRSAIRTGNDESEEGGGWGEAELSYPERQEIEVHQHHNNGYLAYDHLQTRSMSIPYISLRGFI